MGASSRIILAADVSRDRALQIVELIGKGLYAVKAHALADKHGVGVIINELKSAGANRVLIDYKIKDTPDAMHNRVESLRDAGASMLTVHAEAEVDGMMAALVPGGPEIYAVTQLTSLTPEQIALKYGSAEAAVLYLARLAKLAGVTGLVCSPQELRMLKGRRELKGLKLATPGVRSEGVDAHDQKRVGTPEQAVLDGCDFMVVGRQLTGADDVVDAFAQLEAEISRAEEKLLER